MIYTSLNVFQFIPWQIIANHVTKIWQLTQFWTMILNSKKDCKGLFVENWEHLWTLAMKMYMYFLKF